MADKIKIQTKEGLDPAALKLRDSLNRALVKVRSLHTTALRLFRAGQFDGGKMRNLDDAECWLTDTRDALTYFLKPLPKEDQ